MILREKQIKIKERKRIIHKQYLAILFSLGILIFTIWANMYVTRCMHRRVILISAIPLVHMLVRCARQNKNKLVLGTHFIWLLLYVIGYCGCWLLVVPIIDTIPTVQGAAYYDRCMNHYGEDYMLLFYFPSKIPNNAKNPHFWDSPQFLQGAQQTAVCYETTKEEIAYYIDTYREGAVYFGSYIETEKNDRYSEYGYAIEMEGGYLDPEIGKYCPPAFATQYINGDVEDYQLLILLFEDEWNHPRNGGLLLNEKNGQVIFYLLWG